MSHFFAYLSRMKLIDRWSLMRSVQPENVQEHSLQVAVTAHALALIKNKYFGGSLNADQICVMAIFHDATEVLTGDLPTPVKYFNPSIREAYKEIESSAASQLISLLPLDLQGEYKNLLSIPADDLEARQIIKAADVICAYIKCLEEKTAGNHEFSRAQKVIDEKLAQYRGRPEVAYFMEKFVPSFALTLDDMSEELNPIPSRST